MKRFPFITLVFVLGLTAGKELHAACSPLLRDLRTLVGIDTYLPDLSNAPKEIKNLESTWIQLEHAQKELRHISLQIVNGSGDPSKIKLAPLGSTNVTLNNLRSKSLNRYYSHKSDVSPLARTFLSWAILELDGEDRFCEGLAERMQAIRDRGQQFDRETLKNTLKLLWSESRLSREIGDLAAEYANECRKLKLSHNDFFVTVALENFKVVIDESLETIPRGTRLYFSNELMDTTTGFGRGSLAAYQGGVITQRGQIKTDALRCYVQGFKNRFQESSNVLDEGNQLVIESVGYGSSFYEPHAKAKSLNFRLKGLKKIECLLPDAYENEESPKITAADLRETLGDPNLELRIPPR